MSRLHPPGAAARSALLLALLTACGDASDPTDAPVAGTTPAPSPPAAAVQVAPGTPVVLISIDTLRADHLPAYGYGGVETPAIDALAADGVVFERAYSPAPLTLPAHASLLTGLSPPEHGLRDNTGYQLDAGRIDAGEVPLLPLLLKQAGYATGAAVSSFVLRRQTGLAQGFDVYEDSIGFADGTGSPQRAGQETLALAREWLREHGGEPFFLFFHLNEPHTPYEPPEPFASRYASAYDGEVAAADQVVGGLLEQLRELEVYDRALVLLLSDHGEGLGEHGEEEHGILLYRSTLHVPLLLKLPGAQRAGSRVAAPVQLADVVPTLAALLGLPLARTSGADLLAASDPEAPPRRLYAETFHPRLHYGWSELASLVEGRFHYIHGPDPELYDLVEDPSEARNLLASERQRAMELRQHLATFERTLEPPATVDPATRERLAALGYVGGGGAAAGDTLPDPKGLIHTLEPLQAAFEHLRHDRLEEAEAALRRAVELNPRLLTGWEKLGETLRRRGRPAQALTAYEQALEISGGTPRIRLALGLTHLELGHLDDARDAILATGDADAARRLALAFARAGRLDDAAAILQPLVATRDPAATRALARILSEQGRQRPAEALLERALHIEPESAEAHELIALVALREGRWPDAVAASRRALELDETRPEAWNQLGVALYSQGRQPAALDAWERAVTLDPNAWDTLFNLGTRAAELGRREQAWRALSRFVEGAPEERYRIDLRQARVLLRRLGG